MLTLGVIPDRNTDYAPFLKDKYVCSVSPIFDGLRVDYQWFRKSRLDQMSTQLILEMKIC